MSIISSHFIIDRCSKKLTFHSLALNVSIQPCRGGKGAHNCAKRNCISPRNITLEVEWPPQTANRSCLDGCHCHWKTEKERSIRGVCKFSKNLASFTRQPHFCASKIRRHSTKGPSLSLPRSFFPPSLLQFN